VREARARAAREHERRREEAKSKKLSGGGGGGGSSATAVDAVEADEDDDEQTVLFKRALHLLDGEAALEEEGSTGAKEKVRCRAAEAIKLLQDLLHLNRDYRCPSTTGSSSGGNSGDSLASWVLRAHVRARRCPDRSDLPVVDDFHVGDIVEFLEEEGGFWERGDMARVIGMGRATMPIALQLHSNRQLMDVDNYHVKLSLATEEEYAEQEGRWAPGADGYEEAPHYTSARELLGKELPILLLLPSAIL
jgi:hypothetical protein